MPRGKATKSLELIKAAYQILEEIQPATVRAVCYRLFTIGLIPNMSKVSTNRVSKQLVYARENGLIPWAWVVDETREAERVPSWRDPEAFAEVVQGTYRRDRWADQPQQVEVWSEKGTVRGTLAPVLNKYGMTFRVFHGYSSATTVMDVTLDTCDPSRPLLALYAGDWDPSGSHMSEMDLPYRLARYGGHVKLIRVALTHDDVCNGNLPFFSAEAKRRDPRYKWYMENYGIRCWELDALNPVKLRSAVKAHIISVIDQEYWNRCDQVERAERGSLAQIMGMWNSILRQATK